MSRNVVVCSAAFGSTGSVENNINQAQDILDWAAADGADITCFPEIFITHGVRGSVREIAQPVEGQITGAIAQKAKEHGLYVICPMYENDKGTIYNTSVVVDRSRKVIGKYRKVHPTLSEIEEGVEAGKEIPVFELDFGKIGCIICFDIYYPQVVNRLAKKGAEIIFFSSVFEAGFPLRARAWDNSVYIVSSSPPTTTGPSYFIDVTGEIIERRGKRAPLRSVKLNLDKKVFCTDYNLGKHRAIIDKYGLKVDIHILDAEGIFTIESQSEELSVEQIKEEFELEELKDYLKRSEEAIKKK